VDITRRATCERLVVPRDTATLTFIIPCCDSIDFNNDSLFHNTSDIDSLLSVFRGGPCM
jgi:hypothetical protein